MQHNPIGIIDSGFGGFSVWQELLRQLPEEQFIYLADSKNCPYGNKTPEEIYLLAKKGVEFLLSNKVKLVVIACNTITVHALKRLRDEFKDLPIIGIVPVVKTAAEMSKTKRIGILSTVATSKSAYQKKLIKDFAYTCLVTVKGTDKLVPLVERGEVKGKKVRDILKKELKEFIDNQVDAIALGCSHFPFLKNEIQNILENVLLLDSSAAVARHAERILLANNIAADIKNTPTYFYTTGSVQKFNKVAKKLISKNIISEQITLK